MPELASSIPAIVEIVKNARDRGRSIGFVPTMGALHAGHLKLMQEARRDNNFVVVSIFVNPLQFDRKDDLDRYPRTLAADMAVCSTVPVDLVFTPSAAELYPREQRAFVDVPGLTNHLCGAFRPGHFRGVATVVAKLFNIVRPDRAYFGEKDAQQLAVIRRMVEDLNMPVAVVGIPTVREPDGLALSSRNKHLTSEQRQIATLLPQMISEARSRLDGGERSASTIREALEPMFRTHADVRLEYFEIVEPSTLAPVERIDGPVLIAGAIWVGSTRLIDNMRWPGDQERN
jgi:pantoate--beta-alanine ligase